MPGSTSDNEIIIKSGVLDMIESGKGVITDREFTIQAKIYVLRRGYTIMHRQC